MGAARESWVIHGLFPPNKQSKIRVFLNEAETQQKGIMGIVFLGGSLWDLSSSITMLFVVPLTQQNASGVPKTETKSYFKPKLQSFPGVALELCHLH